MVRAQPGHRDLFDFPRAERSSQDALLEHVLLSLPLTIRASYRFRRESHINAQELLAYRTALKVAASRPENWYRRVPFMVDSQVVANVIHRGRSSSHQLNYILQTCLALILMCGLSPLALWVGTHENPADDPTRGLPLRPPQVLEASAAEAIEKICQRHRWVYLVTKAQWLARLRTWDQTLGFPGEGPQRRPMPLQNEGRDLRVRVTELTMKRYAARMADFEAWLISQGLGRLDQLVKNPASLII
eukprot:1551722-Amphidinium_carterae.2